MLLLIGPALAAAVGALRGGERRRRRREEEPLRQLALAQALAELAGTPGVELEEEGGGTTEEAVLPPRSPLGPPSIFTGETPSLGEPTAGGALRRAAELIRPPGGPGAPGGTPPFVPEEEAPVAERAPGTLRDIARIAVGGRTLRVGLRPGETRTGRETQRTRSQRRAFDALHEADPEAYPTFVEGFDYLDELGEHAQEVRAGKREERTEERLERREERGEARRLGRERKQAAAELAAMNLITGNPQFYNTPQKVLRVVNSDANLRGALTPTDVQKLLKDFRQTGAQPEGVDPGFKERREGVLATYGKPKTKLEQRIADALALGHSKEAILAHLKSTAPPDAVTQARRYLNPTIRRALE